MEICRDYNIGDMVEVISDGTDYPKGFRGIITDFDETDYGYQYSLNHGFWVDEDFIRLCKSDRPIIKVKYHDKACCLEQHGDWIDLKSRENFAYTQGSFLLIPLGVSIELPEGYEAHVLPRSSTFKRYGIIMANSMGVIDHDYCGDNDEWMFPALALRDGEVKKGDRIAQFRIVNTMGQVHIMVMQSLGNENRGGLGSTGI